MAANNDVVIEYGNFAPGAKEAFTTTKEACIGEADFFNPSQLSLTVIDFPNYGNAAEPYSVPLDGSVSAFPNIPETENMGFWSAEISQSDGSFETPPQITMTAMESFSVPGITLTFDTLNNIFPKTVYAEWYEGETSVYQDTFSISNAQPYLELPQSIEFNKLVLTFDDLNMPNCRLKLRSIDYGYGTEFSGEELRSVKVVQEINPISSEITINTLDFTIDSKRDTDYSFQTRQPLTVKIKRGLSEETVATTFVRKATRKGKKFWDVQSEDYIGLMTDTPYSGGVYDGESANAAVLSVVADIFATAGIMPSSYDITGIADLENTKIKGWIPYSDCRSALMQIAFACRFVVDTSGDGKVKLYKLSNNISQSIEKGRIRQNQRFSEEDDVTAVEITSHTFIPKTGQEDRVLIYRVTLADVETGSVTVRFDEPFQVDRMELFGDDSISATLIRHNNYAIITGMTGTQCYLLGYGYSHKTTTYTKSKSQVNEITKNVKKVSDNATLINDSNVAEVLNDAFEFLTNVKSTEMTVVDRPHGVGANFAKYGNLTYGTAKYGGITPYIVSFDPPVNVGEKVTVDTDYYGIVTGRVLRSSYSLKLGVMEREVMIK